MKINKKKVVPLYVWNISWLIGLFIPLSIYADFSSDLENVIANCGLQKVNIGIEVLSVDSEKILYSKNSSALFEPASNVKILTSITALKILGAEYTFKTEVFYNDTNIYIKGYGNPELKTSDIEEIADSAVDKGINKVNNIIYDNSYFDEEEFGKGWVYEPNSATSNPKISALSLNENRIIISVKAGKHSNKILIHPKTRYFDLIDSTTPNETGLKVTINSAEDLAATSKNPQAVKNYIIIIGSSSESGNFARNVPNPALYTATIFKECLEQKGIKITGKIIEGKTDTLCKNICTHLSNPLLHLIYYMNKNSNNFYAEQILKTVGAQEVGIPGSFEKGAQQVYKLLKDIGLTKDDARIFDGSGLSRYNLISPHGLVKVLESAISEWGIKAEFMSSLPLAGTDGTLKNRLRTNGCKKNVRAKTGTMISISSLAGYAYTGKNNLIIFSIMMDNYVLSTAKIKQAEDKIVELIINEL